MGKHSTGKILIHIPFNFGESIWQVRFTVFMPYFMKRRRDVEYERFAFDTVMILEGAFNGAQTLHPTV